MSSDELNFKRSKAHTPLEAHTTLPQLYPTPLSHPPSTPSQPPSSFAHAMRTELAHLRGYRSPWLCGEGRRVRALSIQLAQVRCGGKE